MKFFALALSVVVITVAARGSVIKVFETEDNTENGKAADGTLSVIHEGKGNAGFVVLMETGDVTAKADRSNPRNWSDVLEAMNVGGVVSIQLTSPDCGLDGLTEPLCDVLGGFSQDFVNRILNDPHTSYLPEMPAGATTYTGPSGTQVMIFSNSEDDTVKPNATGGFFPADPLDVSPPDVPEPSTWLLLGLGLPVIVVLKKRISPSRID